MVIIFALLIIFIYVNDFNKTIVNIASVSIKLIDNVTFFTTYFYDNLLII
jgi:hypothetical protein